MPLLGVNVNILTVSRPCERVEQCTVACMQEPYSRVNGDLMTMQGISHNTEKQVLHVLIKNDRLVDFAHL